MFEFLQFLVLIEDDKWDALRIDLVMLLCDVRTDPKLFSWSVMWVG